MYQCECSEQYPGEALPAAREHAWKEPSMQCCDVSAVTKILERHCQLPESVHGRSLGYSVLMRVQ